MTITHECFLEIDLGEISFEIEVDTEDGDHELLWETCIFHGKPYSPSLSEIKEMQEIAEDEARHIYESYHEEKRDIWFED